MQKYGFDSYDKFHKWSVNNFKDYWKNIINVINIEFKNPYNNICDDLNVEKPNWLVGAKLNIVDSCFKAHYC